MNRRDFLGSVAVGGGLALAGCIDSGGDDAADPTTTETPTGTPTQALTIVDASLETVEADCGSPGSHADSWELEGDTVTIDGTLVLGNPCAEATLDGVAAAEGVLTVNVGAASTLEPGEPCQDCIGNIDFEVTVELEDGSHLEDVTVEYEVESVEDD